MWSFYKPKIYRSPSGCCICKAKSSSSRFTGSTKYEEHFLECFQLSALRQGEICNACVLVVKRWKKLPAGVNRNWHHMVDSRAGRGKKTMIAKPRDEQLLEEMPHFKSEYCSALSDKNEGIQEVEMQDVDLMSESAPSETLSDTTRPGTSKRKENVPVEKSRRKGQPKKREALPEVSDFVDMDYWTKEPICCGVIFRGLNGEVLIDHRFLKPCNARLTMCKLRSTDKREASSDTSVSKVYSDSSSDSGYD